MALEDNMLAGYGKLGEYPAQIQLLAGDAPTVTSHFPLSTALKTAGAALYTVVALNAAGELVALAPAATDGTQRAIGFLSQPVPANYTGTMEFPAHVGGFFNHLALVWPAGTAVDNLAERRAAFAGSNIFIGEVKPILTVD